QGLADAPSGAQLQHAMAERKAQGLAHLGHALEDRPAPLGRQHIDLAIRILLLEAGEQRLRHHHVADPAGSDDQDVHAIVRGRRAVFDALPGVNQTRLRRITAQAAPPGRLAGCGPMARPALRGSFATYLTRVRHSGWASVLPVTRSK